MPAMMYGMASEGMGGGVVRLKLLLRRGEDAKLEPEQLLPNTPAPTPLLLLLLLLLPSYGRERGRRGEGCG